MISLHLLIKDKYSIEKKATCFKLFSLCIRSKNANSRDYRVLVVVFKQLFKLCLMFLARTGVNMDFGECLVCQV